jgi:hypothetical protein
LRYLFLLLLSACVSQQEVRGKLYQLDRIPADLCEKFPELKEFGAYRVISETEEELLPFCSERIKQFLAADRVYVEAWLKQIRKPR